MRPRAIPQVEVYLRCSSVVQLHCHTAGRTEAGAIKSVLQQKGLACVYLSDRSNLFASAEAKDVLRLLNGIWHANDTSKVASSLASPLWGYSAQTLIELLWKLEGGWRH